MKYGITRLVLNCNNFIEISQADYEQIKNAKQNLVEILNIEEKFNFIIENYREFEQELLNINLNNVLFSYIDWSSSINTVHTLNRKLINLLTTCKLYIDQVQHDLNRIFKDSSQLENFKNLLKNEYDSNLGYRVIEAMRNYVQHRNFPIYTFTSSYTRIDKDSGFFIKYTATPYIEV